MTPNTPERFPPGASPSARGPIDRPRGDFKAVAYWLSLGASAGGLGGFLVGGLGGRLAMFVLRLTSPAYVRGIESDDGFTIGRFDFFSTLNLLAVTTVMGSIVGLFVIAGRPFFPRRGMPLAWAAAGAVTGGALLLHEDGVDFRLLQPHWLAAAFFIAIPAAGAGLIACLVDQFPRFWAERRAATGLAGVFAVPSVIFFPVALVALVVAACWWVAMRSPGLRTMPTWQPARVAAIAVFAIVVALGASNLAGDLRGIL